MPKLRKNSKLKQKQIEIPSFTPERETILLKLKDRYWFKKTDSSLQNELIALPDDFNGFLSDLASRPETIGNVDVLKLVKLAYGNYHALPVFEVRSNLTNEKFTYEYFSWKYGRFPGYKGLILIEVDDKIQFFVIKRGQKFAISNQIYDAIGTTDPTYFTNRLVNLPASVNNQLKKLLGVSELHFKKYIDLGLFNTDAASSNNHTALFAAIINIDENNEIIKKYIEGKQFRTLAPGFELEIHPIERLKEFILKSDDSFFLAIVARLAAQNIVNL